jgi:predicted protein tyrosine phosphatase
LWRCRLVLDNAQLEITSYARARRIKRRGFAGVITIEDPNASGRRQLRFHAKPHPAHLILQFEDLDTEVPRIRTPSAHDVATAIEFAKTIDGPLLIHCFAGISRSTSIALANLASRMTAGTEQQSLAKLLSLVPKAVPNLLVIKHADNLLHRTGALLTTYGIGTARWRRIRGGASLTVPRFWQNIHKLATTGFA